MDVAVLLGILAFAGVLIGVLAGAFGNRALMRRNNNNRVNPYQDLLPPGKCAFEGEMWGKLWDKHVTLEEEIKTNRQLLREEFRALGSGFTASLDNNRRETIEAMREQKQDMVDAINGLRSILR